MIFGRLLKDQCFLILSLLALISLGTTVFDVASGRFSPGPSRPNIHRIPSPPATASNHLPSRADPSSLIQASEDGNLDAVQVLLTKEVDVNLKRMDGATALILASQNGHSEVVQALLAKGADVNARTNDGTTALMIASRQDHLDVVQALLIHGANVNAKTNHGSTALTDAKDVKIRALLIQAGAKS